MREQDVKKLQDIRNKHAGGRAFIIATGRSLLELDQAAFARLKDEPVSIGMNFLMRWKKMPFVPQYYVACESDAFNTIDGTTQHLSFAGGKFFTYDQPSQDMLRAKGWNWIQRNHHAFIQDGRVPAWVDDPLAPFSPFTSSSTPVLGTVVWDAAVQLALWLGCREIYVLGMDADKRGYVFYSEAEKEGVSDARVQHVVDIADCIGRELAKRGIIFETLTPGGNLQVKRSTLEEVLNGQRLAVDLTMPVVSIPSIQVIEEQPAEEPQTVTTVTPPGQEPAAVPVEAKAPKRMPKPRASKAQAAKPRRSRE